MVGLVDFVIHYRGTSKGNCMEDISITFDGDMSVLGGAVYINRKAFSDYVELMNHTQEDEFNKRLDDLTEANNRAALAKYPFVSFTKPADLDPKEYTVEQMGLEHVELREIDEEFKVLTARDRA